MRSSRSSAAPVRIKGWLVTGPLGRGFAFALDFAAAIRTGLAQRRR